MDPTQFDTKNPGTGTGTQTLWLQTEGKYALEFQSQLGTTNCSLPAYSVLPNTSKELKAVKCRPKFWDRHLAPNTTPIDVFLPIDSRWDAAATALEYAMKSWNAQMPANAQYNLPIARGTCNGGPGCVQVSEANQASCGFANGVPGTNQQITANAVVILKDNWTTWSDASLKRTFAHELGHLRGLHDYDLVADTPSCAINDAAMQKEFTCPSGTTMNDVTLTDSLAANTVYDGETQIYCGF